MKHQAPAPRPLEELKLPAGLTAYHVRAEEAPRIVGLPEGFGDVRDGDILLVVPDTDGRAFTEQDGQLVLVGEYHGFMRDVRPLREART